ncbi:MAG: pyridoxamine 5'-phosphate oxidase family protein [Pseudomonadota bacterium]
MAVKSVNELRALYPQVNIRAKHKVIDHIDEHCRDFIASSPFFLLATTNGQDVDVSPKGDPAGSVVIEEGAKAILIADRPGNNRLDGLENILKNPWVGTIFLIPGVHETLRINGPATIHAEPEILDQCLVNGRRPLTVTRVETEEVYLHCAKALIRSKLWDPGTWPGARPVPTMGEMIRDHTGSDVEFETQEQMLKRYETQLY